MSDIGASVTNNLSFVFYPLAYHSLINAIIMYVHNLLGFCCEIGIQDLWFLSIIPDTHVALPIT